MQQRDSYCALWNFVLLACDCLQPLALTVAFQDPPHTKDKCSCQSLNQNFIWGWNVLLNNQRALKSETFREALNSWVGTSRVHGVCLLTERYFPAKIQNFSSGTFKKSPKIYRYHTLALQTSREWHFSRRTWHNTHHGSGKHTTPRVFVSVNT